MTSGNAPQAPGWLGTRVGIPCVALLHHTQRRPGRDEPPTRPGRGIEIRALTEQCPPGSVEGTASSVPRSLLGRPDSRPGEKALAGCGAFGYSIHREPHRGWLVIIDVKSVTGDFALAFPLVALVNPSFEVDGFAHWPGYGNANGHITGWIAEPLMGLNPVAPAGTNDFPFADNGTIPDGRQVAFLQQNGALRQAVTGLVIDGTYRVEYWENAQQATYGGTNDGPVLEVRMGTNVILSAHTVSPIGAYSLRQSRTFLATSDRMELAFVKLGPPDLDRTVLIDNVRVVCCSPPMRIATSVGPGTLTFSWDASVSGFTLESTESLTPPVAWTPVEGAGSGLAIVSMPPKARFYRLRSEP
jgi:hypothetical protein